MPDTRDMETMLDDARGVSMDDLEAENAKLRDMLFACVQYIEIYAETIRHEPWRQQALDLLAGINAVPGARDHQN